MQSRQTTSRDLARAARAGLASAASQGALPARGMASRPASAPPEEPEHRVEPSEVGASRAPRVSIGLPVYNGENYLESSLDSLLAQTFRDFELIVADNASSDRTPEICAEAARRDSRVRFIANPRNIGGFANHNLVAREARGELFMWAGHDDVRQPEYLERCVAVLDARPEVVCCYSRTRVIDETGAPTGYREQELHADDPDPAARYRSLMSLEHRLEPIYGVFRRAPLMQTTLQDLYPDSDRTLLAEMALHGPFVRLEDELFLRRDHADRSIRQFASRRERARWIHPDQPDRIRMPYHHQLWELFLALGRAGVSWRVRPRCWRHLLAWTWTQRDQLLDDWQGAGRAVTRRVLRRGAAGDSRA